MIIFETARLVVRRYNADDRENFFQLNGDPEVVRFIRKPKSRPESDVFLQMVLEEYQKYPLYGRWAVDIKTTGEFIGSFSILQVENTELMHLGYALLPDFWGSGYATELAKNGIEYCFSKTPLDEIYAIVEEGNSSSMHILEKTGFKLESNYQDESGKKVVRYLLGKK